MKDSTLKHILAQIEAAKADLKSYRPEGVDWHARATQTAHILVPWLCTKGEAIRQHVEGVLNSKRKLREAWKALQASHKLDATLANNIDENLRNEGILLSFIAGDVVSSVIGHFLATEFPNSRLIENGKSDYPDMYFADYDYRFMSKFKRNAKQYGAALKGVNKRPVRVPDGIEIKTCRGKLRVDCHHPHMGLHLALLFNAKEEVQKVTDIRAGFLRPCDYRKSNLDASAATTIKHSFNGDQFHSILYSSPIPSR